MHTADEIPLDKLAATALANVGTEYPFHLTHLARSGADVLAPRSLHPVFHGAYDWHSCAHMHWTLARCLRLRVDGELAASIAAHFDARFTPAAVAGECAYFSAPGRATFERPYGWGWLLQLAVELDALAGHDSAAARWRDALAPLAALIAGRLVSWLPRAEFPARTATPRSHRCWHCSTRGAAMPRWQLRSRSARAAGSEPIAAIRPATSRAAMTFSPAGCARRC